MFALGAHDKSLFNPSHQAFKSPEHLDFKVSNGEKKEKKRVRIKEHYQRSPFTLADCLLGELDILGQLHSLYS